MLTTIKGVYKNGQIILEEAPPTTKEVEVLVTFTEKIGLGSEKKERKAGFGIGMVTYISPDFDQPLQDLKDYM